MATASSQLAAYIDRILRMKEEADALAEDIRGIYAEAKAEGYDKTQMGKVVNYLRQKDKKGAKVEEAEAVFDLYLGDYLAAKQMAPRVRAHTHTREDAPTDSEAALDAWAEKVADRIDPALLLTIIEGSKTEAGRKIIMGAIETVKAGDRVAELRANPAMSIVDANNLKKPEPQSAPQAGSDLTDPAPAGQVANHPEAKASKDSGATEQDIETPADSVTGDASRASVGAGSDATNSIADSSSEAPKAETAKSVEPSAGSAAPATKYPEPGVVVWENTPPEPVRRHEYSAAFGELGQDIAVIEDDLANAAAQPIVKIGNVILDGWARYTKARSMVGLDGMPVDYPVVQYDGRDPLLDCIRWNLAGRILNDAQKRTIAERLGKLYPQRRGIVFAAFEMGMELVE